MSGITTKGANELFWMGRYVERVYTTISEFFHGYDSMIDDRLTYQEICRRFSIPNVYTDQGDFLRRYPFDDANPDSIISNLMRAHDNAIVLRDDIGSETLAYIQLAIYDMRKAAISSVPLVGMMRVVDDLFAFWGCMDDTVADYSERSIVKAARRVERIDIYLRLGMPPSAIEPQISRLNRRIASTGLRYDQTAVPRIRELLASGREGYPEAIRIIESMVDV